MFSCDVNTNRNLTYLALGDSYTIGEGVDSLERYPNQFVNFLSKKNITIDDLRVIAKTGWTTDELKEEIISLNITKKYDLVSLLIGVNNQYRGRSSSDFKKEFKDLLNIALNFSKNKNVSVLTIPNWGATPFAKERNSKSIRDSLIIYNKIVKDLCNKYNVDVIDIFKISNKVDKRPELLASDSLHPSGLMYSLWAKKMIDEWKI